MATSDLDPAGLDPVHILGICYGVTGSNASLEMTETADGIRVSFPSRRAAWTAVNALGRVGYTAAHSSGDRHTRDLIVTGWNANRLDSRLTALRTVMHGLADNPLMSATAAVRRFAALPKAAATPAAANEILEETRQQLRDWADTRAGISVPFPPGRLPGDSAIGMRVRAASNCEQVIGDLVDRHVRVAGHAVAEFVSLRQRMNDGRAQRTAVRRAGVFFHLSPGSIAQDSAPLMSRPAPSAARGETSAEPRGRPRRPRRGMAGEFPALPGSWVPEYLAARGFDSTVQGRWHAGYAPAEWDALTRHLRDLGWPDAQIEEAGLGRRSRHGNLIDVFRDRAVFPVRSPAGTVAGFIGRAPDEAAPGVPKYLNSPRSCLYDKGALLFGLWEARAALKAGARPVIVEGPLDAIAVSTAGRQRFAGVAPCGTALMRRHLSALNRVVDLPTVGVLAGFDADPAGRRAAVRAYHLLCQFTDKVDAVSFQSGQDPAQILADEGPAALAGMLATYTRPLADLVIDSEFDRWANWLRFAEGQVNALRATAKLIAAMPPSHVGRQVSRVAIRLGMTHATVTHAVTDALTERHQAPGMSPGGSSAPSQTRRGGAGCQG